MKRSPVKNKLLITLGLLSLILFCTCLPFLKKQDPLTSLNNVWVTKKPMPMESALLSIGVVNNKIYAVGGTISGSEALNLMLEYDTKKDRWKEKAPLPTPRAGLAVGVVNGKIYAVGGFNPDMGDYYLKTVEEYDPATDRWTEKAPMPTPRAGHAVGVINGKLFAIGGSITQGGSGIYLNTVEEYDPVRDTWTSKESMPTSRADLGVGVVGNKLYAIGGTVFLMDWQYYDVVEEYDPVLDAWFKKSPMPNGRSNFALGVANKRIYIIGGLSNLGGTSKSAVSVNTVDEYHPGSNSWTVKAPFSSVRYSLGSGVVNNRIYAIGGIAHGSYSPVVEVYKP